MNTNSSELSDYFDKLESIIEKINNTNDNNDNQDNDAPKDFLAKIKKSCPNCVSEKNVFQDSVNGYKICTNCGLVLSHLLENDAEWRWYGAHDSKGLDPTRCGIPVNPLLPKSSMGTYIGGNKYGSLQRLHSWNAMPSDERSLWHVFEDINIKTQNSGLVSKIKDEAKMYYKMLSCKSECIEGILTRGTVREGIKAACLFVACKNNGVPRSSIEISKMFGIQPTDVTKGLKKFIEIEMKKDIQINVNVSNPQDFVKRYCSKLLISKRIEKIALIISKRAQRLGIVKDNTPPSIAAGIIYLIIVVFKLNITKVSLKEKLSVSDVTVSKCYKRLWEHRHKLFIGIKKMG
jgi:transcription initiation factor TFIIB